MQQACFEAGACQCRGAREGGRDERMQELVSASTLHSLSMENPLREHWCRIRGKLLDLPDEARGVVVV